MMMIMTTITKGMLGVLLSVLLLFMSVLPVCEGVVVFGLVQSTNMMLRFNTQQISQIDLSIALQVPSGVLLRGIDFRPFDGRLYGLANNGIIYIINSLTGQVTPWTNLTSYEGCAIEEAAHYAIDWHPVLDELHIMGDTPRMAVDGKTGVCRPPSYMFADRWIAGLAYDRNIPRIPDTTTVTGWYFRAWSDYPGSPISYFDNNFTQGGGGLAYGSMPYLPQGTQSNPLLGDIDCYEGSGGRETILVVLTEGGSSSLYSFPLKTSPPDSTSPLSWTKVGVVGNGLGIISSIAISLVNESSSISSDMIMAVNQDQEVLIFSPVDVSSVWKLSLQPRIPGLLGTSFYNYNMKAFNSTNRYTIWEDSRTLLDGPLPTTNGVDGDDTVTCTPITGASVAYEHNTNNGTVYAVSIDGSIRLYTFVSCSSSSVWTQTTNPIITALAYSDTTDTLFAIDAQNDVILRFYVPGDGGTLLVSSLGMDVGLNTKADFSTSSYPGTLLLSMDYQGEPWFAYSTGNPPGMPRLMHKIESATPLISFSIYPSGNNNFHPVYYANNTKPQVMLLSASGTQVSVPTISQAGGRFNTVNLTVGVVLWAIAFRMTTDEIYGVGSDLKLYLIGADGSSRATGITITGRSCMLSSSLSYKFDPVVDVLRVVGLAGQNYEIEVETGTCTALPVLLYASSRTPVVASSLFFLNNYKGSTYSPMMVIDSQAVALVVVPYPNNGATTRLPWSLSTIQLKADLISTPAGDQFLFYIHVNTLGTACVFGGSGQRDSYSVYNRQIIGNTPVFALLPNDYVHVSYATPSTSTTSVVSGSPATTTNNNNNNNNNNNGVSSSSSSSSSSSGSGGGSVTSSTAGADGVAGGGSRSTGFTFSAAHPSAKFLSMYDVIVSVVAIVGPFVFAI
eukprot:TRINITY_DN10865_c0_g1_i4.p1 TRINITY_DN10865_c0_g1~~TRINITY_DN10865_c0_g1_i4.p1  ORF type:complete len:899 (+),score=163.45 TRINITY_DN10865_c0_g1_i4:71-2767(+)